MKTLFRKYGLLFVAIGISLTGQFMIDSGSTRVRGKDVAELRGALIERKIPLLSADQKYVDASVAGSVASVTNSYTVPDRILFEAVKDSLTGLRAVMSEGLPGTPFEVAKSTPWFTHGSAILSNSFVSASDWSTLEIDSSPAAFADRSGTPGRKCAAELCNYNSFIDYDLSLDGFSSRWNKLAGLTNNIYAFELGGHPAVFSGRLIRQDILAAERVVTNASRVFFHPRPPLEILPGSYRESGSTSRVRTQASRAEAIRQAAETWSVTRTDINDFGSFPKIMSSSADINQFFAADDWNVQLSKDVAKLIARPLWPCRQAVEGGRVASVETYLVVGIPWSFESYSDNPARFSTGFFDQHSPAQLGLPADLLRSPMPRFALMTSPPYSTALFPTAYVATRVGLSIKPRTWPLPSFTVDFSDFAVPSDFPGRPNGTGNLSAEIRVYGLFSVATFIFEHDFRD